MAEKLFLVAFTSEIDRKDFTKFLDTHSNVTDWFYNMPNSLFVKARLTAEALSKLIESRFGEKIHIVVEIGDYYGRLPADHWKRF